MEHWEKEMEEIAGTQECALAVAVLDAAPLTAQLYTAARVDHYLIFHASPAAAELYRAYKDLEDRYC